MFCFFVKQFFGYLIADVKLFHPKIFWNENIKSRTEKLFEKILSIKHQ